MKPSLRQLQYLVAIADTGRFGDASKRLNVTQPTLSAQVSEAEKVLGAPLIERGRFGAKMTPLGNEVVKRARDVLRGVEEIKQLAAGGTEELAGRLTLGVLPSVGPYLLPNAIKKLHALFPNLRLVVREGSTVDLENDLSNGVVDLIISTAEDHRLHRNTPMFEETLWICAAPDDELSRHSGPVSLKHLSNRALLSLSYGYSFGDLVQRLAERAGAHIDQGYRGTSLDAIRQMAVMGAGVAILPSLYVFSEATRDPDFLVRKLNDREAKRIISLIWRENTPLAEQFTKIGEILTETATQLASTDAHAPYSGAQS